MYIKPSCLSSINLNDGELKTDKKRCRKFGPCGVGEKALYLNSFYIDRCYYVPISSVKRVFKRVAMSKGGFSGKGVFASIPYLVVEYDNGKHKQCTFKDERHVDQLLALLRREHPDIPQLSEQVEKRLAEKKYQESLKEKIVPTKEEQVLIDQLKREETYLNRKQELADDLSLAAKRKRSFQNTNPSYRWVAMTITVLGLIAMGYGIYSLFHSGSFGLYFMLFGFAAIFLFAGYSVLPTARNNKRVLYRHYDQALQAMQEYVSVRKTFPLPARYAHPLVLQRMQRVIGEHRAASIEEALETVKKELKALTPDVQVDQEEYDEVVVIKPLFAVADYE